MFGNKSAAQTRMFLQNYGEGHVNRIARTFAVSPTAIKRQLLRFESGGLLVSRVVGKSSSNPSDKGSVCAELASHYRVLLEINADTTDFELALMVARHSAIEFNELVAYAHEEGVNPTDCTGLADPVDACWVKGCSIQPLNPVRSVL